MRAQWPCLLGMVGKQNERIPAEVLIHLNKAAEKNGLDVFLLDTGAGVGKGLYRAKCIGIQFSLTGDEIPSPDPNRTPDYYTKPSPRPCPAWFRFNEITAQPIDENILRSYSYVEVKEFFKKDESRFEPFNGKVIWSTGELSQQERSIWFIRRATKDDPVFEIVLSSVVKPAHFPRNFRGREDDDRTDLLWLSDLHFGRQSFPSQPTGSERTLLEALERACKKLDLRVAGVIISGDIAWKEQPAEFNAAAELVKGLNSMLGLERDDYVICPGNHDFRLSKVKLKAGQPIEGTKPWATENFSRFYRELFGLPPNRYYSSGRRFLLGGAYPVEIVALNSVGLLQTMKQFQGFGLVGDEQLEYVDQQYGWSRLSGQHHPLSPAGLDGGERPG